MDAKIRRLENNMTTIGLGIIVFGFWSFIKFVLTYLMLGAQHYGISETEYSTIAAIILWTFAALSPLVYLWIGLSARAEGSGKHKSVLYLIALSLIVLFSTLVIILEILSLFFMGDLVYLGEMIVTLIIDMTRMIFLIELMVYSITLRTIRKQQRKGEEDSE